MLALPRPAAAHPAPFSYLDVVFRDGGIEGTLVIHVIDAAHELGISPPERLLENDVAERTREQLGAILKPRLMLRSDRRLDHPVDQPRGAARRRGAAAQVPHPQREPRAR